jgi:hypothetical protein
MNRKWIFLIFLLFTTSILHAQSDLIDGTIVTLQGETLTVKIKPAQPDKLAKGISILNDTTQEFTKLNAKNISYFKYGESEYFAKTVDGKLVFMEREIDGPCQMFTYTYKVEKGNDRVEVVDYYVEKKEDGKFSLMDKKTFKTTMSDFYSDDQALSEKIKGSYYTYNEKEATVEEYNDWVAQGKPGKTWRKEDGNYTKDNGNDSNNNTNNNNSNNNKTNNNNNNRNTNSTIYDGSKFAIDIPVMANYSLIVPDQLVSQLLGVQNTSNGFGYNLGVGLRWQLNKSFFWRNGINFKMKRFHSTYQAESTDTSQNPLLADEYGNLHYFGIYSTLQMELGNFIAGAGFEFAFANIYRPNYSIKNNTGAVIYTGDYNNVSIVASNPAKQNNFNLQFDLNLVFGYKIRLAGGALNLKPVFQYSVPLVSIFDVAPPFLYNRFGVNGYLITLGVIVDVSFPTKPKPKSLLED